MTKRRPYSYTVLRYVHDALTGEFANVGVVMFMPMTSDAPPLLKADTRKTIGRMRDMFPDLARVDFISAMRALDRALSRMSDQFAKEGMFPSEGDALTFARKTLPSDDSAFQWSPLGSGLTDDPQKTFDRLFERYVTRYDVHNVGRRSDDEVWRPVRAKLEARNIPLDLQAKTIRGGDDKIDFQHAWKNGTWHVYEAISLDLADADGIYKKAHRWLGQLTSVAQDADELFHPHFIVGAPANPDLTPAYHRAIKILQKSPVKVEVFEESQIDLLVDRIEDEMRAHHAA